MARKGPEATKTKVNGHVERTHRTHTEEFYEVHYGDLEILSVNQALKQWEWIYHVDRRTSADNVRDNATQIWPLSHMY